MSGETAEDFIAHYGVRGMRWGVHRRSGSATGGPSRLIPRKSAPASGKPVRRSKAEMEALAAQRKARIEVGKQVLKAVAIAVGTVAVASFAGPVVAAGAGAIARALPADAFAVTTTTRTTTTDSFGNKTSSVERETK